MSARSNDVVAAQISDAGAFGRSVVQSADGAIIFGQSNTWSAQQIYQISDTNNIFLKVLPDASDTYSKTFNFVGSSFPNTDGSKNFVARIGHNIAASGAPVDVSRSSVMDEWEQHYDVGAGLTVVERHMAFQPAGGSLQRYISLFARSDGTTPTLGQNTLLFNIDQTIHLNRTGATEYYRVDGTAGFWIKNLPVFRIDMTATGAGLRIDIPTGTTAGNVIDVSGNGNTSFDLTQYGELTLRGSTSVGTSSSTAVLDVQARAATTNAVVFRSTNGTEIFSMSQGGTNCIITVNETFNYGQLSVMGSGSRVFSMTTAGAFRTNQTSSGTTLGSVTNKMPIYNMSGVLQGYIPIYNSIT